MTIEEAKKLLPPELKYPLPDGVIDNLINVTSIPLQYDFEEEENANGYYMIIEQFVQKIMKVLVNHIGVFLKTIKKY